MNMFIMFIDSFISSYSLNNVINKRSKTRVLQKDKINDQNITNER
jgi:hypothetical protein